jgi:hypothetical protein
LGSPSPVLLSFPRFVRLFVFFVVAFGDSSACKLLLLLLLEEEEVLSEF